MSKNKTILLVIMLILWVIADWNNYFGLFKFFTNPKISISDIDQEYETHFENSYLLHSVEYNYSSLNPKSKMVNVFGAYNSNELKASISLKLQENEPFSVLNKSKKLLTVIHQSHQYDFYVKEFTDVASDDDKTIVDPLFQVLFERNNIYYNSLVWGIDGNLKVEAITSDSKVIKDILRIMDDLISGNN